MIVWPANSSSRSVTNSIAMLTSTGQPHATESGVRMIRTTSTTAWIRKQPRPGPRSPSRGSPL